MNNTTLGILVLNPFKMDLGVIPNLFSMTLRLPIHVYILQLIISSNWILAEFYTFNEAIFEVFYFVYDILAVVGFIFPNPYLLKTKTNALLFIVTGHSCHLTVSCVEHYLAVGKPMLYMRCKPLKYKLSTSLVCLVLALVSFLLSSYTLYYFLALVGVTVSFVMQIFFCILTLLVLKQPSPGDPGIEKKNKVNKKMKAFRKILFITCSIILVYVPLIVIAVFEKFITMQVFPAMFSVCYSTIVVVGLLKALVFLEKTGKIMFINWK